MEDGEAQIRRGLTERQLVRAMMDEKSGTTPDDKFNRQQYIFPIGPILYPVTVTVPVDGHVCRSIKLDCTYFELSHIMNIIRHWDFTPFNELTVWKSNFGRTFSPFPEVRVTRTLL